MKHVMADLETYGTTPGCALVSIGAIVFTHDGVEDKERGFYAVINRSSQGSLNEDRSTMEWCEGQSPEARVAFEMSMDNKGVDLFDALSNFNSWASMAATPKSKLWGNGADFDNTILDAAYREIKIPRWWGQYSNMCYRTLKEMFRDQVPAPARKGVHHNALDDAITQAEYAVAIFKHVRAMVVPEANK